MTEFWDRNGKPLPLLTWAYLYEQTTYKWVARDVAVSTANPTQAFYVSTVWEGFDVDVLPGLTRPPGYPEKGLLYDTAVLMYDPLKGRSVAASWRSATEADAPRQHDAGVEWACEWLEAPVVIRDPVVPARPPTGWNVPRRPERGVCQACRSRVPLNEVGMTVGHDPKGGWDRPQCAGSYLRPALGSPNSDQTSPVNPHPRQPVSARRNRRSNAT